MIKYCEWCNKEYKVYSKKDIDKRRFCSKSCSAKWRNATHPEYITNYWTKERRHEQSVRTTQRNLQPEYNKKLRKRMKLDNPVYKPGVVDKIIATKSLRGNIRLYWLTS